MSIALTRLGYEPGTRLLVVHADDVGMCHATLPAIRDLFSVGVVTCAATMVPCPWFPAVAQYCREHPEADMGVHLTLNCEWSTYRWRPVSTADPASGLLDEEGYMPQSPARIQADASQDAVAHELSAQLGRALAAGIDVTHLDSHMGTVFHPRFARAYISLALDHDLPPFLAAQTPEWIRSNPGFDVDLMLQIYEDALAAGVIPFDNLAMLPLDDPEDRVEQAKRAIADLPEGLSLMIIHPAIATPELETIAPDWQARVADYEAFTSDELASFVESEDVRLIGYRELRDALRRQKSAAKE